MNTRIVVAGLLVLLVGASSANALGNFEIQDLMSRITGVANDLREITPDGLTDKQNRNRNKAVGRLVVDGSDFDVWLRALQRSAKPLAKAVSGTPDEDGIRQGIIGVLVGLRSTLEEIADDLEARSEGGMQDFPDGLGPDSPPKAMLSTKGRDKVRRLLTKARVRIHSGGGDDQLLGARGKILKDRVKALRKALASLEKADRKLDAAGM